MRKDKPLLIRQVIYIFQTGAFETEEVLYLQIIRCTLSAAESMACVIFECTDESRH